MSKHFINIKEYSDTWVCDDCGTIFNSTVDISLDGKLIYSIELDGHFGNDNYYPIIDGEKSQSELGYIEHILNLLGLDEEMEYILEQFDKVHFICTKPSLLFLSAILLDEYCIELAINSN